MREIDQRDRFIIRFDRDTTRVGLKVMAAKNRRSMNDEILHLIDKGWEVLYGGKPGDEEKAA